MRFWKKCKKTWQQILRQGHDSWEKYQIYVAWGCKKEGKWGQIINNVRERERERDLKKVTHIQRQWKTAQKEKEKVTTLIGKSW